MDSKEVKEHQRKSIDDILNSGKPIWFSFPKNVGKQQIEGRMNRENSVVMNTTDYIDEKKKFTDKVLKDTNKQKKNKNRDVR